jgi:hypothetical protein
MLAQEDPKISKKYNLVDYKGYPLSEKDEEHFQRFEKQLLDAYKEGNAIFIFRGDKFSRLEERLCEKPESSDKEPKKYIQEKVYENLFFVGEKAKCFWQQRNVNEYNAIDDPFGGLTINNCEKEIFSNIFHEISEVLSHPNLDENIRNSCSTGFIEYFRNVNNCNGFIEKVETACKSQNANEVLTKKIKLRDYYLTFLHVDGSNRFYKKSIFVSTSLSEKLARKTYAGKGRASLTIYGFIPRPYEHFITSPWLASNNHEVVWRSKLPTYQPFGLYPKEFEASAKGALFPNFIIGVRQNNSRNFMVNFNLLKSVEDNQPDLIENGFKIDDIDFFNSMIGTAYAHTVHNDSQGNYLQHEQC